MAHGTPDWGVTAGAVTTYQLTDLADLAARLGSIVTFDRRGDVIFLEDFEDGLPRWDGSGSGAGSAVDLSHLEARSGFYSCRLHTGGVSTNRAYIYRFTPLPVLAAIGLEFSCCFRDIGESIELLTQIRTGETEAYAGLLYNYDTRTLSYRDSGGDQTTIVSGLNLYSASTLFHTFKLVIDLSSLTYVRAIVNDQSYDLSGTPLEAAGLTATPYLYFQVTHQGELGTTNAVYVDDVILTQNEPV